MSGSHVTPMFVDLTTDLFTYPTQQELKDPDIKYVGQLTELTIPDTHGNMLGLFKRLVLFGVVECNGADYKEKNAVYQRLVNLFRKDSLTKTDLAEFDKILEEDIIYHGDKFELVRLLGDILADRSGNDYFTLAFLEQLKKNKVNVEINLSNHDLQFLKSCFIRYPDFNIPIVQAVSLNNFKKIKGMIDPETLSEKIKCYLSLLRISHCAIDEDSIGDDKTVPSAILYRHAPAGLEIVEALYNAYAPKNSKKPQAPMSTPLELYEADEIINQGFCRELKTNKFVKRLRGEDGDVRSSDDIPLKMPLHYTSWNTDLRKIKGTNQYQLTVVHGHAGGKEMFQDKEAKNLVEKWQWNKQEGDAKILGVNLDVYNTLGFAFIDTALISPDEIDTYVPAHTDIMEGLQEKREVVGFLSPSSIPSFKKLFNALQESKGNPLHNAGMYIYQQSKKLLNECLKDPALRQYYQRIRQAILTVTTLVKNPDDTNAQEQLTESIAFLESIQNEFPMLTKIPEPVMLKPAKTSCLKPFISGLLVFLGVCALIAGVAGVPYTLGGSLALGAKIAGSCFVAAGIGLGISSYFDRKNQKPISPAPTVESFTFIEALKKFNNK